jgi:hypothetical protein
MNSELPPTEDPAPDRAPSLVELPEGILAQVGAELAAHGGTTAGDPAAQRAAEARILEILRAEQFADHGSSGCSGRWRTGSSATRSRS